MSFKIPSLEEARKKREASASTPPQFFAGQKRPAAATAPAAAAPAPASATTRKCVNPYAKSGVRPVNPYAKSANASTSRTAPNASSRPASASSVASQSRSSSSSNNNNDNTTSNRGNTSRWNRSTAEAYAIRKGGTSTRRLPPPPPDTEDNPYASFSQAFGDVEDTEHFQKELEAIRGKGAAGNGNKARAEQRAFDAASVSAENGGSASTPTTPGNISVRDSHIALQPHVLHVSTKQRGNAVLNYVRNVPFAYSTMVPDYIFSPNRCALFLSCKYHNLHPNYIHRRISELRTDFDLRVLLCLVDIDDNAATLLFLNKLCVVNNMTLILAWSNEEAARYLETFKAFEGKDASSIQRREQTNFADQVSDVLCAVRSVNKTDSAQLMSQFGTLRGLMSAPMDELSLCPGIGEKKVRRLYEAFHKPFSSSTARLRGKEKEQAKAKEDESAKKKKDDDDDDAKKPAANAALEDDEEERFYEDDL